MDMRSADESDERLALILGQVTRFLSGDYGGVLAVSESSDEVDAISSGLNELGRRLQMRDEQAKNNDDRLEERLRKQAELLTASELKYRQLFEDNPMPLWVLDRETLQILDVNDSALQVYGYTREEFLSMTSVELRPEEERPRYLALNRETLGTQHTGVWTHIKKDGSRIFVDVTVHEMSFGGRRARLILANDVTEKTQALRELQLSEARFRRVFNSDITGFSFWDASGKITQANDLFLDMVGYTRKDLLDGLINLDSISPAEYAHADLQAREEIRISGVCRPYEKEYLRKDGTRIPVMIGAARIDDDNAQATGVTCVMDMSHRKQMEQEILELNRDLEQRINERTKALQEVNKELESFTYSVSHDLRAPLRAIHGYSQMLFEDYGGKLDEEGVRLLNAVKFNAKRMGQLVDDLLAFSRIGKRRVAEKETDLTRLVHDVLAEVDEAEKKHAKITIHRLGTAVVDEPLVRQAFQNLISNALKYSSRSNDAQIEIGATSVDGVPTYFVKDNGAGFDMAYYKKLFGVFQRLHEQDEFEGTGVGLAIVQRIVQRHGGRIWAEGKVGEGAVFFFTLSEAVTDMASE